MPLAWAAELDADPAKLNPWGGAIALGHALGASGTRLLGTLARPPRGDRRSVRAADDVRGRRHGQRHDHRAPLSPLRGACKRLRPLAVRGACTASATSVREGLSHHVSACSLSDRVCYGRRTHRARRRALFPEEHPCVEDDPRTRPPPARSTRVRRTWCSPGAWRFRPRRGAGRRRRRTFTLVGSLQSELGCPGDWQPDCDATDLAPTGDAGVYAAEFEVPAGSWEYKVAVNDAWDESYGLNGGGDNIPLTSAGPSTLRFLFDDNTNRVGVEVVSLARRIHRRRRRARGGRPSASPAATSSSTSS